MPESNENKRQAQRISEKKKVEFFVDADIVKAESMDTSETGIRIVTTKPIQISMRIYQNESTWIDYQANLCWAGKSESENMAYGLEFVEEPDW
ncbi:MAG: PilZ domain-containing protein [Proteobacteria bacterium]|nr:PilZ domain-containing protein [Pseudomonadota bacterium]MBU1611797.1 PilZ domain-containing protein [Pseudomonadota bacterium]